MAHCADMKLAKPSVSAVASGPHDHAAMMAMGAMANDPSMAEMNHAQHVVSAQKKLCLVLHVPHGMSKETH